MKKIRITCLLGISLGPKLIKQENVHEVLDIIIESTKQDGLTRSIRFIFDEVSNDDANEQLVA